MSEKEKFDWNNPEHKQKRDEEAAEHTQAMEEIYSGLPEDKDELLRRRSELEGQKDGLMQRSLERTADPSVKEVTADDLNEIQDQLSAINRKLRDLGVDE